MDDAKAARYEILIRESHLDTFGHVNNATYLQIYEEARWDVITAGGFGLKDIQRNHLGPVILELKLKFLKELRLRQKITIFTHVHEYKGKIGQMRQWMKNADGELCSEMDMTFGLFNTQLRKLVEPTPEWMKAIGLSG